MADHFDVINMLATAMLDWPTNDFDAEPAGCIVAQFLAAVETGFLPSLKHEKLFGIASDGPRVIVPATAGAPAASMCIGQVVMGAWTGILLHGAGEGVVDDISPEYLTEELSMGRLPDLFEKWILAIGPHKTAYIAALIDGSPAFSNEPPLWHIEWYVPRLVALNMRDFHAMTGVATYCVTSSEGVKSIGSTHEVSEVAAIWCPEMESLFKKVEDVIGKPLAVRDHNRRGSFRTCAFCGTEGQKHEDEGRPVTISTSFENMRTSYCGITCKRLAERSIRRTRRGKAYNAPPAG